MLGARAKAQVAYDLDVKADRLGDKLLQDVEILRRVSPHSRAKTFRAAVPTGTLAQTAP